MWGGERRLSKTVSEVSEHELREWEEEQGEDAVELGAGKLPLFLPTPDFMASAGEAWAEAKWELATCGHRAESGQETMYCHNLDRLNASIYKKNKKKPPLRLALCKAPNEVTGY